MLHIILLTLVALASFGEAGHAQSVSGWDPSRAHLTRADLEELLERYEQTVQSAAYSERLRARASAEAQLIRDRLEEGDFRVGDRVLLVVEGQEFPETLTVEPGRRLVLPSIGDVPLEGVLRSELEAHLTEHIGRYIINPTVHARSLIRVSILGEVGQPGFFLVPSEALVTDALMQAGGPTRLAALDDVRIERGAERIWEGPPLREAMSEGRTLDQLSLRAGDAIVVPTAPQRQFSVFSVLQTAFLVISSLTYLISRL